MKNFMTLMGSKEKRSPSSGDGDGGGGGGDPQRRSMLSSLSRGIVGKSSSRRGHGHSSPTAEMLAARLEMEEERAEKGLLESVEARRQPRRRTSSSSIHSIGGGGGEQQQQQRRNSSDVDAWHASMDGERPPLANVTHSYYLDDDNATHASMGSRGGGSYSTHSRNNSNNMHRRRGSGLLQPNYFEIAQKMRNLHGSGKSSSNLMENMPDESASNHPHPIPPSIPQASTISSITTPLSSGGTDPGSISATTSRHRRHASRAHHLLEAIKENPEGAVADNDKDDGETVSSGGIFGSISAPGASTDVGTSVLAMEDTNTDRLIAGAMMVEQLFTDDPTIVDRRDGQDEEGIRSSQRMDSSSSVHDNNELLDETVPLTESQYNYGTSRGGIAEERRALLQKRRSYSRWSFMNWCRTNCFFDPRNILQWLYQVPEYSLSFRYATVLTLWAALFYYFLGNPSPKFIPGQASVSWCLLFCARQLVSLDLARLVQFWLIDGVVLNSRWAVKLMGPLVTLVVIQARGWPFSAFAWAIIDVIALHGTQSFQEHWLYWTDISLFASTNTGLYVLTAPLYNRILLGSVLAGIFTAVKRTLVALYFGRRTLVEFKPRLEKMLNEIIILSEVAELAVEAAILEANSNEHASQPAASQSESVSKRESEQRMADANMNLESRGMGLHRRVFSQVGFRQDENDDENDDDDDDTQATGESENDDSLQEEENMSLTQMREMRSSSRTNELLAFLEKWNEPRNVMDKTCNASISDILKFRRALTFMDEEKPFGAAFGFGHTREAVIESAQEVYRRLKTLSPENDYLPFDALEMLAHEGDGRKNRNKLKTIKRMFRHGPDRSLSMLDFVRSCDNLYKRLRFFRAAVGNASVIDHHLESIIDSIFYFLLALMLLSITGLNPWPLLVSLSTLMVSVSFAVGSSASKYIEGILLIAARRPYDLGDRIYMMDPNQINSNDGICVSWFVEDINLFNTTVRYAASNEVATINNGSIANMRIVNGNRSPNAVVRFQLPFQTKILRNGCLDEFEAMLDRFAESNPRQWESYLFHRVDQVDPENDKLMITIGFQHRSSWQDLNGIRQAKAKLMCHVLEYGKEKDIIFEGLPMQQLLYYAGKLQDGPYKDVLESLQPPSDALARKSMSKLLETGERLPEDSTKEEESRGGSGDIQPTSSARESQIQNAMFLAAVQKSHG